MDSLHLLFLLICLSTVLLSVLPVQGKDNLSPEEAAKKREMKKMRKSQKVRKQSPEKQALKAWAESLADEDYDVEHWKKAFHTSSASDFFHAYARKISDLFKKVGAKVNFALVGM
jgi:hypothetical protein